MTTRRLPILQHPPIGQDQSAEAATQRDGRGGSPLLQFAQQNLPALEGHPRSARSIRKTMQSGPDVAANQQSKSQRSSTDGRSEQSRTRDSDTARRFVVEQPRPRVTVTDPRSKVNIEQPQPRVTVRQQAPTVTIDQPPPEIVVHMPQPQVDVQDRDPGVSVNVPPPQVNVEQQGGSARVQVQSRSDDAAQVQYERARPQVKFERAGEPRVVYRPTEQEPKVRYESKRQEAASTRQQQAASSRSGSMPGHRMRKPVMWQCTIRDPRERRFSRIVSGRSRTARRTVSCKRRPPCRQRPDRPGHRQYAGLGRPPSQQLRAGRCSIGSHPEIMRSRYLRDNVRLYAAGGCPVTAGRLPRTSARTGDKLAKVLTVPRATGAAEPRRTQAQDQTRSFRA